MKLINYQTDFYVKSSLSPFSFKNPSNSKKLINGREAFWDDKTGTLVIKDSKHADGGTAFKPTKGKGYFNDNIK